MLFSHAAIMANVTQITQMRQRRKETCRRNPTGKIGQGCALVVAILFAVGAFLAFQGYSALIQDLPSVERIPALLQPPEGMLLQPTRLYDRSGEHQIAELRNPLTTGSEYLYLAGDARPLIPGQVISATLAADDPRFWQHRGFTLSGLVRDEAPTLAQRMASELLLPDEPAGWRRELRQRLLAFELTSRYGRQQVLEWYINSAHFGHMAFGVDAASHLYLDKPGTQLSIAEAALLAAIPDDSQWNPIDFPQAALDRQKQVILKMLQLQFINPADGIQAAREVIALRAPLSVADRIQLEVPQDDLIPALTRLALDQLEGQIRRSQILRGGLRVITTMDFNLFQRAACVPPIQLQRLQGNTAATSLTSGDCPASGLLPELASTDGQAVSKPQIELLILDPHTGQILLKTSDPNEATHFSLGSLHPAGTLSTPFIYLTAFTQGLSPASLAWDIPAEGLPASISTSSGQFHGPVRLRTALVNDYLSPSMQLIQQLGLNDILRTARQIGLLPAGFSPPTGATPLNIFGEVSLLQASQAFAVLANQGVRTGRDLNTALTNPTGGASRAELSPTALLRLEDLNGTVLLDWSAPESRPILTPQLAYLLGNVLSDEPARWPSLGNPNYLEIGRPAAVKIGRSFTGNGSWVVGYTPQLVVGLWAGSGETEPANPSGYSTSDRYEVAAIGLWSAVARSAHQDLAAQSWTVPDGLTFTPVCDPSGMLPTPECPAIVDEVFLAGNEPTQEDTLFRSVQVNRDTGALASLFTLPDLLETKIVMAVPTEAREWAGAARVQLSPDYFDPIPSSQQSWENAGFRSPRMFEVVHGVVNLSGTAAGEDFRSYRLQVGKGLNPQAWYQVGAESTSPVTEGELGAWDTTGLDGLYALQLLVIRQDKNLQRSTILVTVDNQPPVVEITSPKEGAQLSSRQKPTLLLQAEVEDNLGLKSVLIFLDGRLLETLYQQPYAIIWNPTPGAHSVRFVAEDLAGNKVESSAFFSVD